MSTVAIPRGNYDSPAPCWIPNERYDNGAPAKPSIKCQCGKVSGIELHHVHADGTVTASFFHASAQQLQHDGSGYFFQNGGKKYYTEPGCGWHVFLNLESYDQGDFPPEK